MAPCCASLGRTLHARIAEALESQFADIAQSQPELLARHCTEAGQIEKAAGLWGNAGQRSLERSALVEAAEQLTRALAQIAVLPATPALRREQIKLQVTLIAPLIDVKGFAAPETKAAAERARLLIEQAEALGEPPEDPLLLFSVLYGFWVANLGAFNGDVMRDLAAHFLALAEKQGATIPLMIGHRLMGVSLTVTGDIARKSSASRSGDRALRSCRASSAGDAFWPRHRSGGSNLQIVGSMAPWLSRGRAQRRRRRAQECPRDGSSRHADVRVISYRDIRHPLRQPLSRNRTNQGAFRSCGRKRCLVLEGGRNGAPRLRIDPDRQSLGRSPHDHLRNHRISVNGNNAVCAVVSIAFGQGLCGTRPNR